MILIGESKVKGTQPLLSRYSYWNLREKESSVAQLCLTLCDLKEEKTGSRLNSQGRLQQLHDLGEVNGLLGFNYSL